MQHLDHLSLLKRQILHLSSFDFQYIFPFVNIPDELDVWPSLTDLTSLLSPHATEVSSADSTCFSSCRSSRNLCCSCSLLWFWITLWAVSMTTSVFKFSAAIAKSSSSSSPRSQASLVLLSNSWKVLTFFSFTGVVGGFEPGFIKLLKNK